MIFARCNCHTFSVAIVAQRGLLASFPTLLKRTILSRSDAAVADALCLAVVDALCFAVADALAAAGAMPVAVGQQMKKQLQKNVKTCDQLIKHLETHVKNMRPTMINGCGPTQLGHDFQRMYADAVVALASAKKCQQTRKRVLADLTERLKKQKAEDKRARREARRKVLNLLKRPAGAIAIADIEAAGPVAGR